MATMTRVLKTTCATAAICLLAGCWGLRPGYTPGGPGISGGPTTYVSEPFSPKTVTLEDVRSGEAIWSIDVPVGQQLVVRFYRNHDEENTYVPDLMRWELMDAGRRFGRLDNSIPVPDRDSRRLEMTLREVPEYPPTSG